MSKLKKLSRREKQILELLIRLEQASAKEIQEQLPDAPGNSSVRTHLTSLVKKGFVNSQEQGLKYVYTPALDIEEASRSVLKDVVETFFKGEPLLAVNQLLSGNLEEISDAELLEIEKMIRQRRSQKSEK